VKGKMNEKPKMKRWKEASGIKCFEIKTDEWNEKEYIDGRDCYLQGTVNFNKYLLREKKVKR
jgi:hypothetical protein